MPGSPPSASSQSLWADNLGLIDSSGSLTLLKVPPVLVVPFGLPLEIPPPLGFKKPATDELGLMLF